MSRLRKGFSLIDVVVGVALMLVLFLSLFGVLKASLILSTLAKAKSAATELADSQMEYLHGLAYDSVGTVGGIPAGIVPQSATSTVDGVTYNTRTYVQYTDDPADGLGASDTNAVTTDYKTGKVVVSYTMYGLSKSVTLVSNFVPPGIESTTGGGTLSLHVVDKNNNGVGDTVVQIVNASTSPTINFSTLSDSSGYVVIGGAATSSQFQIYASRAGYSSAQTYARAGQNANPTPGYLTVTKNQTTSATFAIDLLSSLIFATFSPASTTSFSDLFNSAGSLAGQTNTQVSAGALSIAGNTALSGSASSTTITPSYLDGWGILQATLATSTGTTALIHVDDPTGAFIPNAVLPGNSAGFSTFPVSLTAVSTTTYPSLMLEADFTRNATTTNASVLDWSLSYTVGPTPLPNMAFTLTGAKTIGTTAGGAVIYKTIVSDNTGASASQTESLEWDAYTLSTGTQTIDSCPVAPFALSPGTTLPISALLGTPTATTLPIIVVNSASTPLASATVVLMKSGYAATVPTSACGTAYFNNLSNGTYNATVSAAGYTTKTFLNISVSGHTATTTLSLP
jgi:hypothetical protein